VFQLLKNTNIDFMGKRKAFLIFSSILVVIFLVVLGVRWLNLGIEFTGGTELQIMYATKPDLGTIRSTLKDAGLGTPVVTTIGDPALNEVYIRLGVQEEEGKPEEDAAAPGEPDEEKKASDLAMRVADLLRSTEDRQGLERDLLSLNVVGESILSDTLRRAPDLDRDQARALAGAIIEQRKEVSIFRSFDDLEGIEGWTPGVRSWLEGRSFLSGFVLRSQSYIGPAIGKELMTKAMWAVLGSLAGVLIYIGIRFQFRWGVAALAALAHDTIVVMGLFSLFDQEMTLPVVAAFLTLIGYSVNDTVVVFDRIRENIKLRGTQNLAAVVNRSINQTLSRTVITSGSTWVVVFGLYMFGGEALSSFSFVLMIGVLVGTYSSICIASPVLVLWREITLKRKGVPTSPSIRRRRSRKNGRAAAKA
jgi:preprotein translocase subunit SecF